jgi:putative flippase GtrA
LPSLPCCQLHEVIQLLLLLPVLAVLAVAIEITQAVIFILATIAAFLVQHAVRHGCRRVSQHLID